MGRRTKVAYLLKGAYPSRVVNLVVGPHETLSLSSNFVLSILAELVLFNVRPHKQYFSYVFYSSLPTYQSILFQWYTPDIIENVILLDTFLCVPNKTPPFDTCVVPVPLLTIFRYLTEICLTFIFIRELRR